ncbi:MAG TPA: terpene cyclase/mutase family protein [Phycisphaerae bacterium]|nr:terpene cyclase/mutase family protein [Phycisphaerae bacterium]HOJ72431.1 terpene cyclase/mutase family protein [Phycisphaerae bacterium]HOM49907.1 terpene cyclase/mutase family protein [Phycisphaerae bacterium]HON66185.1 terpene cyclase/mutase family protein [Phycisphaerae bacterium]HOQ87534.1 terpene cyclase/mutase family protein [Phycisphaerae bacterium]
MIDKALRFQAAAQREDGGWVGFKPDQSDPAITALVAQTFIQHPDYGPEHPISKRAIEYMLRFQQPDGGIYDPKLPYLNYSTSVALMALAATKSPALQPKIAAAQKCLKDNQWADPKCDNDGKLITPAHPWYGGAGYGNHKRPDLSNTQMMLEALHQSGLPADDPVYQKALQFVQRCQMLAITNDQPFAQGATDGGFVYTAAQGGHSMAGSTTQPEGNQMLRSYGSMTYAGFKSMLYANVDRDDPRVKAAFDWIRRHYTLDSNPNMPGRQSKEGLYYFYHVFAKALEAWGEPFIVDHKAVVHDWRADLADKLAREQREDGSWVNEADRWMEGNPHLVTAYAVLALQTALR